MARGGARKADGPSKKAGRSNFKTLEVSDIVEIPAMPDPRDWIGPPRMVTQPKDKESRAVLEAGGIDPDEAIKETDDELEVDWYEPVKNWWHDIWSSPMSGEFVDSDIHGLYLACYYMHESLNPFYKSGDRIAWAKQFEAAIKNFGLNPSARESLRWQVAQGSAAQSRTNQIRAAASAGHTAEAQKEKDEMLEMYSRRA